jgi:hypothetical protein
MLAPYLHSKMASKPVPPDPAYIETAITLPRPTTIALASENIGKLSEMKLLGQLDFATADNLIADQRVILSALIDEAKLIATTGDPNRDQVIRIEGGLPPLPGTNITMPVISNGHELNGHDILAPPSPTPVPDPPAQDPPNDPTPV